MKKIIVRIIISFILVSCVAIHLITTSVEAVNNGNTLEVVIGFGLGIGLTVVYRLLDIDDKEVKRGA
jgi:hypothetical protein